MGIHTDSHTCRTSNIQDQATGKQNSTTVKAYYTVCHKHIHTFFALPVSVILEHTGGLWDIMYGLYCIYDHNNLNNISALN